MDSFIANYINSWGQWLYAGVAVAMVLDGNITLLVAGFLSSGGVLNPFYAILACTVGGFGEQLILFWAGLKLRNNNSLVWSWLTKAGSQFDRHFEKRPKLALFVTKFIYGIHRSSLVRVAAMGVPLKRFLKISVPVLVWWVLILFGVGYTISLPVFYLFQHYLHYLEFGLLGLLILFILFEHFVVSGKLKKFWDRMW